MKTTSLNLHRTLLEEEGANWAESTFEMASALGRLRSWPEVLEHRCSILVGPANSGKTTELKLQAQLLRGNGAHSCFVSVRDLLREGGMERALDKDELEAFCQWKKVPAEKLCVFVDSIDEAVLQDSRALRDCLRKLVDGVAESLDVVTWVLSTRPAVMNSAVVAAIESELGVRVKSTSKQADDWPRLDDVSESQTADQEPSKDSAASASVFRLSPLNPMQARRVLQEAFRVIDAQRLADLAYRHGLGHMLQSPGKCRLLAKLKLEDAPPSSLEEVFRRTVSALLYAPTGERRALVRMTAEQLEMEVKRLACASTLCGRLNIELPAEEDDPSPQALSARSIVRSLLDSGLTHLLNGDLFEDSGHLQVKLQPDDLRFYLAACRLHSLIPGPDEALKVARVLGWRAATGEKGVFAQFMPLAGWLAALNKYFRAECLDLSPQCVAFFGDLRSLPPSEAPRVLEVAIESILHGQRVGLGAYTLTEENYWQAGAPVVLSALPALFDKYSENDDVRELLLDIARTSRSDCLLVPFLARSGGDLKKILLDAESLAYWLAVACPADRQRICIEALSATDLAERCLRVLFEGCAWKELTSKDLVQLISSVIAAGEHPYLLRYSLVHEVGATASPEQLLTLVEGLLDLVVSRMPAELTLSAYESLNTIEWLAETVSELLTALVQRTTGTQAKAVASLVVAFKQGVLDRDGSEVVDAKSLRGVLAAPGAVRAEVVRQLLTVAEDSGEQAVWKLVAGGRSIVVPSLQEAEANNAVQAVRALQDLNQRYERRENIVPQRQSTKSSKQVEKDAAELLSRIQGIQDGTDLGALSWVAQRLSATSGVSRYGDVRFERFSSTYGSELTSAASEGLKLLWRAQEPQKDENKPNSRYWVTIAALQGLHLDLSGGSPLPALTPAEVQRALDYGLYELNGFPRWYWTLANLSPALSIKFFRSTIQSASVGLMSEERARKVLYGLADATPEMQAELAPDAWQYVLSREAKGPLLEVTLSLLVRKALVTPDEFRTAASGRSFNGTADATLWASNWFLIDPLGFIAELEKHKERDLDSALALIAAIATNLEDGRSKQLQEQVGSNPDMASALCRLYKELHQAIPEAGDIKRPSGKAYSVTDRERAQRTRDRIPELLASTRSSAGYAALKELYVEAGEEPIHVRQYFLSLMRKTAESISRPSRPMSEEEYLEFERTLQPAPASLEAFAQQVEYDLLEVKENLEKGDFSARRFLSTAFQELSEEYIRSIEDDFQLFLAGQLELIARKRYSVFREPQAADDTRRDISIAAPAQTWKATLELKVSEGGWTLQDYRKSLREQLVGLYMKQRSTTVGFFVVLLQRDRPWVSPTGSIRFDGLIKQLEADALMISAEKNIRLRVIGIDVTEPLNPDGSLVRARAAPKAEKAAKAAAKKSRVSRVSPSKK